MLDKFLDFVDATVKKEKERLAAKQKKFDQLK